MKIVLGKNHQNRRKAERTKTGKQRLGVKAKIRSVIMPKSNFNY